MRERHRRFVLEYIIDLNGRAAAMRAGYAPSKAAARASELLRRADVQAMLRAELAARDDRTRVTGDRVIREFARIAFIDPARIAAWGPAGVTLAESGRMSEDDRAAVKSISVGGRKGARAQRFELFDKLAALDALGRYTGVLTRGKGGRFAVPGAVTPAGDAARAELRERIIKTIDSRAKALAEEIVAKKLAAMKALDAPPPNPPPLAGEGREGAPAEEGSEDEKAR